MNRLKRFFEILGLKLLRRLIDRAITRLRGGQTNEKAEEEASTVAIPGSRRVPRRPAGKTAGAVKAKPGSVKVKPRDFKDGRKPT